MPTNFNLLIFKYLYDRKIIEPVKRGLCTSEIRSSVAPHSRDSKLNKVMKRITTEKKVVLTNFKIAYYIPTLSSNFFKSDFLFNMVKLVGMTYMVIYKIN